MRRARSLLLLVVAVPVLWGCGDDGATAPTGEPTSAVVAIDPTEVTAELVAAAVSDVCAWPSGTWSSVQSVGGDSVGATIDMTNSPDGIRYDLVTSLGAETPWKIWSLITDGRMYFRAGAGGWITAVGAGDQAVASGTWADACADGLPELDADALTLGEVTTKPDGGDPRYVVAVDVGPGAEFRDNPFRRIDVELAPDGGLRYAAWSTEGDIGARNEVTVSPDVDPGRLDPPADAVAVSDEQLQRAVYSRSTEDLGG